MDENTFFLEVTARVLTVQKSLKIMKDRCEREKKRDVFSDI